MGRFGNGEGDDAAEDAEGDVEEVVAEADALGLFGFEAVVFGEEDVEGGVVTHGKDLRGTGWSNIAITICGLRVRHYFYFAVLRMCRSIFETVVYVRKEQFPDRKASPTPYESSFETVA